MAWSIEPGSRGSSSSCRHTRWNGRSYTSAGGVPLRAAAPITVFGSSGVGISRPPNAICRCAARYALVSEAICRCDPSTTGTSCLVNCGICGRRHWPSERHSLAM
jgi:hypothetical protein